MIRAILLLPHPDWRDQLIGDRPCGSRPPVYCLHEIGGHAVTRDKIAYCAGAEHHRRALALAWEGAVVREGRDRAAYCLSERERQPCADGVRWREGVTVGGDPSFCLHGDDSIYTTYGPRGWHPVALPGLADAPLRTVHALALVCAARGIGTFEVIRG